MILPPLLVGANADALARSAALDSQKRFIISI